ncbi:MAG: chemotaxis protein CheW [Chloroflexota bacterium]|nr:chemotaxis protein CheW [Chloroflexota bacterium]
MDENSAFLAASLDNSQIEKLEKLSDEEFWNYARALARHIPSSQIPDAEFLECTLSKGDKSVYLVSLAALSEVIFSPQHYTVLPASPAWMFGVIACHGETIAVIDLHAYLFDGSINLTVPFSEGVLLIAKHENMLPLGLFVSAIGQTISFTNEQITSPDNTTADLPARLKLVQGIYLEKLVLDIPVLLAEAVQDIGFMLHGR